MASNESITENGNGAQRETNASYIVSTLMDFNVVPGSQLKCTLNMAKGKCASWKLHIFNASTDEEKTFDYVLIAAQ